MAWEEELFAVLDDLEQQAEALYDAERGLELADRSRSEYQQVTLASRLMASVGSEVVLDVRGVGAVGGVLGAGRHRLVPGQRQRPGLDRPARPRSSAVRGASERSVAGGGVVTGGPAGPRLGAAPARGRGGAVRPPPRRRPAARRHRAAGWAPTSSRRGRRGRPRRAGAVRRPRGRAEPLRASGRVDVVRRGLAVLERALTAPGPADRLVVVVVSSIASAMCRRTISRGSRSRSSRSAYSGPSSSRSSSRALLAICAHLAGHPAGLAGQVGQLVGAEHEDRDDRDHRELRQADSEHGRRTYCVRTCWWASGRAACRRVRGRGRRARSAIVGQRHAPGAVGSESTIGLPTSPPSRSEMSIGIWPSTGTS